MKRAFERFDGEIQWVVSDDGQSPAPCTMGQDHIRNKPAADRKSSFLQNLLAGLKHARHDRILFIEDDDWYSPDYLRVMANWLSDAEIAGESRALYYHVPTRRYKVCGNTDHASLCQTGVRGEIAEWMGDHIQKHWRSFIDVHTWKTGARSKRKFLSPKTTLSVGIKGLPGTSGIGMGHRLGGRNHMDWDGSVLQQWTNCEDARTYFNLTIESSRSSSSEVPATMPESALAILTYVPFAAHADTRCRLPAALHSLEVTGYEGQVFVVDDGSDDPEHLAFLDSIAAQYTVVRRATNGGVSLAKNTCIRLLMEHGVDVGFIAEDDIQFHEGWHRAYLTAHARIPSIHHFSWAWDSDPSRRMRKTPREVEGFPIVESSRVNGVLLTFTPEVIEQVGGFKALPGKWGHTHTNWTRRIIKAGLSPYFCDVVDSNSFIGINEFGHRSAVDSGNKRRWRRANDRPSRDLSELYCELEE
jgi:glycosyltransferase involved in cell wall biosynthesis